MFEKVTIIAEAGSNHNGRLDTALELVRRAAEAGADAVKFQDFTLEGLFSVREYGRALGVADGAWADSVRRLAVPAQWHERLAAQARGNGIAYFSTPFSVEAVDALGPFVPYYKIASCDITFLPLVERVASAGKGVFLSTGASSLGEIEAAVALLRNRPLPFVCLLHCIMLYPAPPPSLNLNFIGTLSERFGLPVGFSDHSSGIDAALAAVAKGAKAIEKHITLDTNQEGADHRNSLDPRELAELVKKVRLLEEMLGPAERVITEREAKERVYARRGIYAARNLKRGERLSLDSLAFLRPNIHLGAEKLPLVMGKVLLTDAAKGTAISEGMFGTR